jgi:hypothetical protein
MKTYHQVSPSVWSDGATSFNVNHELHAKMQSEIAAGKAEVVDYVEPVPTYADLRRAAYGQWGDQLDMQYHDSVDGTTTWVDHVARVKAAHPKS